MAVKQKTMMDKVRDAAFWLAIANVIVVISAAVLERPELVSPQVQAALTVANLMAVAVKNYLDPSVKNF